MKNNKSYTGFVVFLIAVGCIAFAPFGEADESDSVENPPATSTEIAYGKAITVGTLGMPRVRECSGMGTSRGAKSILWAHNDSGDLPQIYAFDLTGKHLGTVAIDGAKNVDWEDMATLIWNGKPYIAIADVGDNQAKRDKCQIHLVPDLPPPGDSFPNKIAVERTIEFSYKDGPHDCESIGFDHQSQSFILVSKSWGAYCDVYELKIPAADDESVQTAKPIARLKLAGFTGFDMAPDATRAIGVTYADAYEFTRKPSETWAEAFQHKPRQIPLPPRRQGEAICYGPDGKSIYTTSEGFNPPLIRIAPKE